MAGFHNLFISHSWKYGETYDHLVRLLDADPFFSYLNFSVPKDDPVHTNGTDAQLYQAIRAKIQVSHVVIILAGVYATFSKWINHEINISKRDIWPPIPIVAVQPWGADRTSLVVKNAADRIVGWNTKSIVTAIRELR